MAAKRDFARSVLTQRDRTVTAPRRAAVPRAGPRLRRLRLAAHRPVRAARAQGRHRSRGAAAHGEVARRSGRRRRLGAAVGVPHLDALRRRRATGGRRCGSARSNDTVTCRPLPDRSSEPASTCCRRCAFPERTRCRCGSVRRPDSARRGGRPRTSSRRGLPDDVGAGPRRRSSSGLPMSIYGSARHPSSSRGRTRRRCWSDGPRPSRLTNSTEPRQSSTPTVESACSPACAVPWRRRELVLVEGSPSACADARHNLADRSVEVVESEVEDWQPVPADVVIADPSRRGLGAAGGPVLGRDRGTPRWS